MENKIKSSKDIILNYGIILGFASILINVVNYVAGNPYQPHWSVSVVSLVVSTVLIVIGIKKIKALQNANLTLAQALKSGLGISLISGLVYVVFFLVLTHFIEPNFYENVVEVQKVNMIEQYPDMTDEQIDSSVAMMEKFSSPWITSAFALIGSLFFGFIISLIAGLALKGENQSEA